MSVDATVDLPAVGENPPPPGFTARAQTRDIETVNRIFRVATRIAGFAVLVITGGVGLFLGLRPSRRSSTSAGPSSPRPSGSRRRAASASPPCSSGTVEFAAVAIIVAFPLALGTALYITEYAAAAAQARPGHAGRPDGRGAQRRLRALGLLPACHAVGLSRWLSSCTSAGSRSSRSDADPDDAGLGRQRVYTVVHLHRRHRGGDDGAPDGLRGHAPGLLPDAAR